MCQVFSLRPDGPETSLTSSLGYITRKISPYLFVFVLILFAFGRSVAASAYSSQYAYDARGRRVATAY